MAQDTQDDGETGPVADLGPWIRGHAVEPALRQLSQRLSDVSPVVSWRHTPLQSLWQWGCSVEARHPAPADPAAAVLHPSEQAGRDDHCRGDRLLH